MGVRYLWQVLTPVGNKSSLTILQDKQIAIDLSCWFYQQIKWKKEMEALILRNIFLRTKILLMMNVKPIFILDGDVPDIKLDTFQRRIYYNRRFRVQTKNDESENVVISKALTSRSYLTECSKLLSLLGVTCLKSVGEGEALCAQLDKEGIVDGIITQDNDAFLYGARKIYRNFCKQGNEGSIEVFEMSEIEKQLNLNREKLIAMSLLCGCDFDRPGITGIGHTKAFNYLSKFRGNVLERLHCIKNDKALQEYEMEKRESKNSLQHGKLLVTSQSLFYKPVPGSSYRTPYENLSKEDKETIDFELKLYKHIAMTPGFPDPSIVNEYATFCQELPVIKFEWDKPQIIPFIDFMKEKCGWNHNFSFKTILPLYCRWSLLKSKFVDYKPVEILKQRTIGGVSCLEVQWTARLNPRSLISQTDVSCIYRKKLVTIEPEDLIADRCKEMYESFMTKLSLKKVTGRGRGRKDTPPKETESTPKTNEDITKCQSVSSTQCTVPSTFTDSITLYQSLAREIVLKLYKYLERLKRKEGEPSWTKEFNTYFMLNAPVGGT